MRRPANAPVKNTTPSRAANRPSSFIVAHIEAAAAPARSVQRLDQQDQVHGRDGADGKADQQGVGHDVASDAQLEQRSSSTHQQLGTQALS